MAGWLAVGVKASYRKLPHHKRGRKRRGAAKEQVAIVPVVRVVERVGIEVPAVVVPVAIDRPQNALPMYATPSVPPPFEYSRD